MQQFLFGVLAVLILLSGSMNASAQTNGAPSTEQAVREVRVVYTRLPPYVSNGPDGPVGYSIDMLQSIAERKGWRLTFTEVSNPAEAIQKLIDGEADLHPNLARSDERAKTVDFSIELGSSDVSAIVDPTRTDIRRAEQTAGMRFGYVQGSIARTAVSSGPFTAVEVESIDALLIKFLNGEVDGVLFVAEAFKGLAWASGAEDRVRVLPPTLSRFGRHVVISKASGLREELNEALFHFSGSDENQRIRAKWFGDERYWTTERQWQAVFLAIAVIIGGLLLHRRRTLALRRKTETEQLRFLTEMTDALPFGVHMVGRDGLIKFANRNLRFLDVDWDHAIANRIDHWEFTKSVMADGRFELEGKTRDEFCDDLCGKGPNGLAPLEVRTPGGRFVMRRIIPLSDGSRLYLREDVTEDRLIKREIENQRSRLNAVLDAAQSGVIGLLRDGRIGIANPMARHMLGGLCDEGPFRWPEAIKFLNPEDMKPLEASKDPVKRALAGQRLKAETTVMSRPDGAEPRYASLSSASIPQNVSAEVGTVLIIDDISEQEKSRQQVERSARLDALGQLTGGIAHDFNNLLATIEYSVQLSDQATDTAKREKFNAIALASVKRGAALTNRLLAFAKRQPGIAHSKLISDVMEDLFALARPTIEADIQLNFTVDDESLLVHCDVAQLENAVLNLVLNSRDAIIRDKKGDRITVHARGVSEIAPKRTGDQSNQSTGAATGPNAGPVGDHASDETSTSRYIEIVVTDNGPGMADEVTRRAIDPFFTTKDVNSGTGLGLSMVYGFVQQSHGRFHIYSEVGYGTTVRMTLPRGAEDGGREEPIAAAPVPRGSGQTVLVAEDEPELMKMVTEMITHLGYQVIAANNGAEAMAQVESEAKVDLLLTDVVMPGGMSGFDLARGARALRPDLRVLYMSGYSGFSAAEMGNVVAPCISKPCPRDELANALDQAFRETAPENKTSPADT